MLSATYLYNKASDEAKPKPPQIKIADSEKNGEQSYFDLESVVAPARSPLRSEALSTSRPGHPNLRATSAYSEEYRVEDIEAGSVRRAFCIAAFFWFNSEIPLGLQHFA